VRINPALGNTRERHPIEPLPIDGARQAPTKGAGEPLIPAGGVEWTDEDDARLLRAIARLERMDLDCENKNMTEEMMLLMSYGGVGNYDPPEPPCRPDSPCGPDDGCN